MATSRHQVSKNPVHVLVVDDELAIRDMIAFSLEREGMEVTAAADAGEALVAISEKRPRSRSHGLDDARCQRVGADSPSPQGFVYV